MNHASKIIYSENKRRNRLFTAFLESCLSQKATVNDIIHIGYRLMRKEKLHPHFFGGNSLLKTAQYLTFYALQLPHEYDNADYLATHLTPNQAEQIIKLFEKRIAERIPVEYLTNEAWYLGRKFYVNENVLIPRSIMDMRFADFLNETHWDNYRVLDLCTGSGCIGISLALLNPDIKVDLADISPQALAVANINLTNYSLAGRVKCIQGDLFENIQDKYDLIITNPPYVSHSELRASPSEFKKEPKIAFDGGKSGLDLVDKILNQASAYLNPNGQIIAEIGVTAAKRLKRKYPKVTFEWFKYKKPNGKIAFLAMDSAFRCEAKHLTNKALMAKGKLFWRIFYF